MKAYEFVALLLKAQGLTSNSLARRLGRASLQSQIYKYIHGQVPSPRMETARPIAAHLGIPVEAMYDDRVATRLAGDMGLSEGGEGLKNVIAAQIPTEGFPSVTGDSNSSIKTLQTPRLGELMTRQPSELDDVFYVELDDNAMAPDFPAGTIIKFDKRKLHVFGSRVLLRDSRGEYHFRTFAQAAHDSWRGLAKNDAFRDIEPTRDGAVVVATKAGHIVEGD